MSERMVEVCGCMFNIQVYKLAKNVWMACVSIWGNISEREEAAQQKPSQLGATLRNSGSCESASVSFGMPAKTCFVIKGGLPRAI
jgi:hypothetical protein